MGLRKIRTWLSVCVINVTRLFCFIDNQILQSLSQCAGLCTIYKLFIVHSS
jgi:hypothetical protein